jgi:hypothetical protein
LLQTSETSRISAPGKTCSSDMSGALGVLISDQAQASRSGRPVRQQRAFDLGRKVKIQMGMMCFQVFSRLVALAKAAANKRAPGQDWLAWTGTGRTQASHLGLNPNYRRKMPRGRPDASPTGRCLRLSSVCDSSRGGLLRVQSGLVVSGRQAHRTNMSRKYSK